MITMTPRDAFEEAVNEWVRHCNTPEVQFSSQGLSVRDCKAYKKISSMGYSALPLIRELYDRCDHHPSNFVSFADIKLHGLAPLVKEIVGEDFSIPTEIQGKLSTIARYTKKWLDDNMLKYHSQ